jgi:hypothetical protein
VDADAAHDTSLLTPLRLRQLLFLEAADPTPRPPEKHPLSRQPLPPVAREAARAGLAVDSDARGTASGWAATQLIWQGAEEVS